MLKPIKDFEISFTVSRYFQNDRVSHDYDHVVTGVSDNLIQAIDDCLNQIAQLGFNIEGMTERILKQRGWETFPAPIIQEVYYCSHKIYYVLICWS